MLIHRDYSQFKTGAYSFVTKDLGGIIENRHTGISTMQKKMKESNLSEPIFSDEREDFVVTFYNGEHPELYPSKLKEDKIININKILNKKTQVKKTQVKKTESIEKVV